MQGNESNKRDRHRNENVRQDRHRKDKSGFVLFCRLMPMLGGCLAMIVGVIIVTTLNARGTEEELNVKETITSVLAVKTSVDPIVSAAEQFPDLDIREDYLSINEYSRPGDKIDNISKIVIHYTGNPGTTAQGNRDYFESLAENPVTSASSHFVIGLDGEIIQCVPLNEIAYASNRANSYSISIECCHPGESGEFSVATYNRCVALTAELCDYYHLDPEEDVIRHYDVTGKECPRYYVEHPEEWDMFIGFVKKQMEES